MITEILTTLADAAPLAVTVDTSPQDDPPWWLLAAGPVGGVGTYWLIYRYYRNQDKSHEFERDTLITAQPVEGSEQRSGKIRRTKDKRIEGENTSEHRARVNRVS